LAHRGDLIVVIVNAAPPVGQRSRFGVVWSGASRALQSNALWRASTAGKECDRAQSNQFHVDSVQRRHVAAFIGRGDNADKAASRSCKRG